ncbi:ECF transporter S component [Mycoplasma anserisalpingitidis]|uniref:ECF transporter S component n=1 Tax=Mycoplasma anserisalpingitidis TaxID=519450 RepID=UPI001CF63D09|nr:ECF transporter S component [Mycoplasma anserisalpingitidis]UCU26696.1 ECF transporter S component [Mycoplasma anserisalpingitidis]UCU27534.1 ECF transporter S component [Mycoplasma anserisalpingitidis]
MKKTTIKDIAYLAIYFALILILSLVPFLGLIQVFSVSINLLTIIIVIATFHLGLRGSLFSALFVGIGSFISALVYGKALFIFADIAIIPRFLLGLVSYFIYLSFRKKVNVISIFINTFVTVLSNSILVTGMLFIHHSIVKIDFIQNFIVWISLIWINVLVEVIVLPILSILLFKFIKFLHNKRVEELKNSSNIYY